MSQEQPNNPLHGKKLQEILEHLVDFYGWEQMGFNIDVNCLQSNQTIKSSLKFFRKELWAREQIEALYLESLEEIKKGNKGLGLGKKGFE